jgi:phosphatidate phosphatase APP1
MAWRSESGNCWNFEIHGWVYKEHQKNIILKTLRSVLGIQKLTEHESKLFDERAAPFLVDNKRGRAIAVKIGSKQYRISPSAHNGHFKEQFQIEADEVQDYISKDEVIPFEIITKHSVQGCEGSLQKIDPHGISILSDIDDTIKETDIANRRNMLMNTFCRPFVPSDDMALLYQNWKKNLSAAFHYISASPYQLYRPLNDFLINHGFPLGTFHLKTFRLKDESFFDLFMSPDEFKRSIIQPILERFPKRKFILVGDATEKDPEIYGYLAKRYPEQILKIYIRETQYAPNHPRYQKAFQGLKPSLWQIFKNATELSVHAI